MNEDSSIIRLRQPDAIDDPLTALLRSGARQLLEQAIEAEVAAFLAARKDLKLADGRDRLVRHGHGPERTIQTGIGPVAVSRVKIRDRGAIGRDQAGLREVLGRLAPARADVGGRRPASAAVWPAAASAASSRPAPSPGSSTTSSARALWSSSRCLPSLSISASIAAYMSGSSD